MAQDYIGPSSTVAFLPRPQRGYAATITPTMPTTTSPETRFPSSAPAEETGNGPSSPAINDSVYLPAKPQRHLARRFLGSCVTVASRAISLVVRYKVELAPALATGAVTGLGWWQHLAGAGQYATGGYAALAVAGAIAALYGVERGNTKLQHGGLGLTIAFGDVAAAVAGGPGAMSLTAAAVSTGVAYGAYVPWLIQHRKDNKAVAPAATTAQVNTTPAEAITAPDDDLPADPSFDVTTTPFYDTAIPYQADDSRDIADPIRIGWDETGNPVYLNLLYRHTLIAGAADWGKSGILNLIIKKLIRKDHVELYGIDLKPGTPELGPWRPLFKSIAGTPEEARDMLKAIKAEGDRRGAYLEQLSLTELTAGREPVRKWVPGKHGTAIYVITDELGELIRQDDQLRKEEAEYRKLDKENALPPEPPVTALYESGLAVLRAFAIHFIAATQQPSARVFGGNTDMRGNYTNKISTRAGEAGHAEFVFGKGCRGAGFVPEKLTRPGEFFLQAPEMPPANPPRCRAEWVSDKDIAADVAHLHSYTPAEPIGRFVPQGRTLTLVGEPVPPKPAGPPPPVYPDGWTVRREDWPDLYRVFCRLCEEQGHATKDDLVEHGPFASRDTVRRALDAWVEHGVQVRKAGRTEQFHLPDADDTGNDTTLTLTNR